MLRYDLDNLPEVPEEERVKVAAMPDEDIDYSDIPEINDFSGFVRVEKLTSGKNRDRMKIELASDVRWA
jgi:hypothetical protein